jgi:hypothetical protein
MSNLLYIPGINHLVILSDTKGIGSRTPPQIPFFRCPSLLYKMAQNLCITYAHPTTYFKPSLDLNLAISNAM